MSSTTVLEGCQERAHTISRQAFNIKASNSVRAPPPGCKLLRTQGGLGAHEHEACRGRGTAQSPALDPPSLRGLGRQAEAEAEAGRSPSGGAFHLPPRAAGPIPSRHASPASAPRSPAIASPGPPRRSPAQTAGGRGGQPHRPSPRPTHPSAAPRPGSAPRDSAPLTPPRRTSSPLRQTSSPSRRARPAALRPPPAPPPAPGGHR